METLGDALEGQKGQQKYYCEKCDFSCSKKYSWERHTLTRKHLEVTQVTHLGQKKGKKEQNNYHCEYCDKIYETRNGLWKHKKNCNMNSNKNKTNENENENITEKELIMAIIKDNSDLKNMMMKVIENGTHNTYNNNMNNSHNKTFNLQFFLNETCKDAMNIMDFVNSMEIELDDLEKVGELGYVNGMTNIILKNLKALDITKRPMHCTDAKREIMYIKDDDKWEKETDNKDKMKKAIKYIVHKNAKMFSVFKAKYPDCIKSYSKHCDQYNKLVIEVLGGKGDNESQNNEKIIRRIAREVTIDKLK
jgi:hypothetical protein